MHTAIKWENIDADTKRLGLELSQHSAGLSYEERLDKAYRALSIIGVEVIRRQPAMEEAEQPV